MGIELKTSLVAVAKDTEADLAKVFAKSDTVSDDAFVILEADSTLGLARLVSEAMRRGWSLVNSTVLVQGRDGAWRYLQAMVRTSRTAEEAAVRVITRAAAAIRWAAQLNPNEALFVRVAEECAEFLAGVGYAK